MAGEKIASADFFPASVCVCVCALVLVCAYFFVCGIKSNQIEATNGRMATTKQKIKLQAAKGRGGGEAGDFAFPFKQCNTNWVKDQVELSVGSDNSSSTEAAAAVAARFQIELCSQRRRRRCHDVDDAAEQRRVACT